MESKNISSKKLSAIFIASGLLCHLFVFAEIYPVFLLSYPLLVVGIYKNFAYKGYPPFKAYRFYLASIASLIPFIGPLYALLLLYQTQQINVEPTGEKKKSFLTPSKGVGAFFILLIAWMIWMDVTTSWKADKVHDAVRQGMTIQHVESLITEDVWRAYILENHGKSDKIERMAFIKAFEKKNHADGSRGRLILTFIGLPINSVSFEVIFDSNGLVSGKTEKQVRD